MHSKLLTSFSVIALLSISTVSYGANWIKYIEGDGKIPNGDCLEMICANGCVEEDGNFYGYCCPGDGACRVKTEKGDVDIHECCGENEICAQGRCIKACNGGLRDGEYLPNSECSVCYRSRIISDEEYLLLQGEGTFSKKGSSHQKSNDSPQTTNPLDEMKLKIEARQQNCKICENGHIVKVYNEKCQKCVDGHPESIASYDFLCQYCDSNTGAIINQPDGSVVGEGCSICSGGNRVSTGLDVGLCYTCDGGYKHLKDMRYPIQCGEKCCSSDGCNDTGTGCKGEPDVCNGTVLLEVDGEETAGGYSASRFTGGKICCPNDQVVTLKYFGTQDLKTTEDGSTISGTKYQRKYFIEGSGYVVNSKGNFSRYGTIAGCCNQAGYTRIKDSIRKDEFRCARDTHLMDANGDGIWFWVDCPMDPCSEKPGVCGGHSDPNWFYFRNPISRQYGPIKEPKK